MSGLNKRYRDSIRLIINYKTMIIAFFLIFFSFPSHAEYKVIHTEPVQYTDLAPGVRHEIHQIFTDEGWIEVNVVRSKSDARQSILPLYPREEITKSATLSDLIDRQEGIVAAINGDFFDYKTRSVLGRIIDRGKVVQSSNRDSRHANFYVGNEGEIGIGYEDGSLGKLIIGAIRAEISYVNKLYTDWDSIILFDGNFGDKSPYLPTKDALVVQVKVEENIVREIIRNDSSDGKRNFELSDRSISEGDFVIYAQGIYAQLLMSSLRPGERVDVEFAYLPFTSISGGAQLVKDGRVVDAFSHNVLGEHPRTAIGIGKDNETVLFVTVNGRSNSYRGLRQSEMAELMIQLGANEALILDGGGSTEMIVSNPYRDKKEIVSFLSDGSERRIYNGLAIRTGFNTGSAVSSDSDASSGVTSNSDSGEILKIRFSKNKDNAIVGVPLKLEIEAIDRSYRKHEPDVQNLIFENIGIDGRFENGYFIPSSSGDGVISVSVNGIKAYVDIHVSGHAVRLEAEEERGVFRFFLHSDDGYIIGLNSKFVSASIPSEIATYHPEDGSITQLKDGVSGYVIFSYGLSSGEVLTSGRTLHYSKAERIIEDFETYNLSNSSNQGSDVKIYPEPFGQGKSAAVELNQLQGGADTKYMHRFIKDMIIPNDNQALLFDIHSSQKGNINIEFFIGHKNGYGTLMPIVETIDWEGWKTFRIDNLNKGDRLKVFNVQTERKEGILYFDNFRFEEVKIEKIDVPANIDLTRKVEDYVIVSRSPVYTLSYRSDDEVAYGFWQNFHFLEIDNKGGYIRRHNGYEQWRSILDTLANATKPVIIRFSGTYYFPDKKEMNLLFQAVESCPQPVFMMFKAYQDQHDIFMHRRACIIEVREKSEVFEISEDFQIRIRSLGEE